MNVPWSVCHHCHSLVLTGVKKKHQKHKPWGFIMSLETQNTFLLLLLLLFLSTTEDSYLLGEIPKDLVDFGLAGSL